MQSNGASTGLMHMRRRRCWDRLYLASDPSYFFTASSASCTQWTYWKLHPPRTPCLPFCVFRSSKKKQEIWEKIAKSWWVAIFVAGRTNKSLKKRGSLHESMPCKAEELVGVSMQVIDANMGSRGGRGPMRWEREQRIHVHNFIQPSISY